MDIDQTTVGGGRATVLQAGNCMYRGSEGEYGRDENWEDQYEWNAESLRNMGKVLLKKWIRPCWAWRSRSDFEFYPEINGKHWRPLRRDDMVEYLCSRWSFLHCYVENGFPRWSKTVVEITWDKHSGLGEIGCLDQAVACGGHDEDKCRDLRGIWKAELTFRSVMKVDGGIVQK